MKAEVLIVDYWVQRKHLCIVIIMLQGYLNTHELNHNRMKCESEQVVCVRSTGTWAF